MICERQVGSAWVIAVGRRIPVEQGGKLLAMDPASCVDNFRVTDKPETLAPRPLGGRLPLIIGCSTG